MTTRRDFIKTFMAGLLAYLFKGVTGCAKNNSESFKNPYEYNVDKFKAVDSALMLFEEIKPIEINAVKLKGIAISKDYKIIVLADDTVYVYSSEGNIINSFKTVNEANCIAVEKNNEIYIGIKGHIEVFDDLGNQLKTWNSLSEKAFITSIAVKEDKVAVADFGNKQLWLFNKNQNLICLIGKGSEAKDVIGFVIPSPYFDVKFDNGGNIWVTNPGNLRLEKYSQAGKFISSWGKSSMDIDGFPGCCNPTHFAIFPDGSFVTAEKGIVRIKLYDEAGVFKGVVANPAQFKEGTVGLSLATRVMDSRNYVYLTDSEKKQIRIFKDKR